MNGPHFSTFVACVSGGVAPGIGSPYPSHSLPSDPRGTFPPAAATPSAAASAPTGTCARGFLVGAEPFGGPLPLRAADPPTVAHPPGPGRGLDADSAGFCAEIAAQCVCTLSDGHNGPHHCTFDGCDGQWNGHIDDETFEVVRLPGWLP